MELKALLNGTIMAGVALLAAPAAQAQDLMLGHGFSPNHFIAKDLSEPWMSCVKEGSQGGVTFQYFPSGQISNANATLDALNSGLLQVASVSIGYVTNKMPLNGVSMLPNMGETSQQMVAAYRRSLEEVPELAAEMTENRIHPLVVTMFPPYQVLSRGEPVDTLEKFDGRLVRTAGSANTLAMQQLGAAAVEMPAADIYVAMERGTVDAALLGLSSIKSYSLQELMKSVSANGQFGTFTTLLAMDLGEWEKLTPETQAVVDQCSKQVEADVARLLDTEHDTLLEEFAGLGITVFDYSDEELAKLEERLTGVADEFVERLGGRGLPAGQVRTAYEKIISETPAKSE